MSCKLLTLGGSVQTRGPSPPLLETALSLSPLPTSCFIWNQFPPRASSPGGSLSLVRRAYSGNGQAYIERHTDCVASCCCSMQRTWKCSKGGPFRAEFKVHKAPGDVGGNDKTLSFFELNKKNKKKQPTLQCVSKKGLK